MIIFCANFVDANLMILLLKNIFHFVRKNFKIVTYSWNKNNYRLEEINIDIFRKIDKIWKLFIILNYKFLELKNKNLFGDQNSLRYKNINMKAAIMKYTDFCFSHKLQTKSLDLSLN